VVVLKERKIVMKLLSLFSGIGGLKRWINEAKKAGGRK
jgi:hypothetical protein